jgi:hypothetical protein
MELKIVTTEELKIWIKWVQKRYIDDNVTKGYDRDRMIKLTGQNTNKSLMATT